MRKVSSKSLLKILLSSFIVLVLSGCVTHYGSAAFRSEPVGVQVYDLEDGSVIGVTPVNFLWKSSKTKRKYMNVRMHKNGYKDVVKAFWLSLDYASADQASSNPQLVQFEMNKESE